MAGAMVPSTLVAMVEAGAAVAGAAAAGTAAVGALVVPAPPRLPLQAALRARGRVAQHDVRRGRARGRRRSAAHHLLLQGEEVTHAGTTAHTAVSRQDQRRSEVVVILVV